MLRKSSVLDLLPTIRNNSNLTNHTINTRKRNKLQKSNPHCRYLMCSKLNIRRGCAGARCIWRFQSLAGLLNERFVGGHRLPGHAGDASNRDLVRLSPRCSKSLQAARILSAVLFCRSQ